MRWKTRAGTRPTINICFFSLATSYIHGKVIHYEKHIFSSLGHDISQFFKKSLVPTRTLVGVKRSISIVRDGYMKSPNRVLCVCMCVCLEGWGGICKYVCVCFLGDRRASGISGRNRQSPAESCWLILKMSNINLGYMSATFNKMGGVVLHLWTSLSVFIC